MESYVSMIDATHATAACHLVRGAGSDVRGAVRAPRAFTVIRTNVDDVTGPQVWSPPV